MRVWLIKIGEVLPIDGENPRLYRMGMLANYLIEQGHEVVWWASDFDHFQRKHRFDKDQVINLKDCCQLVLMNSMGYSKSVSVRRLLDHCLIAKKFKKMASFFAPPDLILCSMPTIELAREAIRYGRLNNVPVVLDLRDLWPDIFLRSFSKGLRPICKKIMWPYYRQLKQAIRSATAVTGITQQVIDWGLKLSGRKTCKNDQPFYLACKKYQYQESKETRDFWARYGVGPGFHKKVICFIGSMSRQFDFDTIINVARKLKNVTDYYFVMCGNGEFLEGLRKKTTDCSNIVFPGRLDGAQIQYLLNYSYIGLAPYQPTIDFLMSLPNKIGEYFSAGLPVVAGIDGVIGNVLQQNRCGVIYDYKDEHKLYDVLFEFYSQPDVIKKMSEQAMSFYNKELSADVVYPRMVKWLESISV